VDKYIESNIIMTSDNIIKFPFEKIKEKVDFDSNEDSLDFVHSILDIIHDEFHIKTGECIFTDPEYESLTNCIGEVLLALYLKSKGIYHPFHDIADEVFSVDIDENMDYDELSEKDEEI
jgi:hypothetical protein